MKKRAGDRFRFRPELGRRLHELRIRAGLTQQMLAVAMGSQRKGNHTVVSRLENGRMANPGIGLVVDYMLAFRPSSTRATSTSGASRSRSRAGRSPVSRWPSRPHCSSPSGRHAA